MRGAPGPGRRPVLTWRCRRGAGHPAESGPPPPAGAAGARGAPVTHLRDSAGRVEPHPVLHAGRLQGEPVGHVHAQHPPAQRPATRPIGIGVPAEGRGRREGGNGALLPESPPPADSGSPAAQPLLVPARPRPGPEPPGPPRADRPRVGVRAQGRGSDPRPGAQPRAGGPPAGPLGPSPVPACESQAGISLLAGEPGGHSSGRPPSCRLESRLAARRWERPGAGNAGPLASELCNVAASMPL